MKPLISVIVPIYNAEVYLKECVKSIQEQAYTNLEIILVNDGSTDQSLEICKLLAKGDARIVILNQINSGVSSARNHGMNIAKGEYIGFVDSDDYIDKTMYETLYRKIVENDTQVCVMLPYTVKPLSKGISDKDCIDKCKSIIELFKLKFPSSLWAYLYSKDALNNKKLNEKIHFFEDFEFNYRVLSSVEKIALSFEELYHYRKNETSINSQSINFKKMTCLNIYDEILYNLNNIDCDVSKYAIFFRSHFLIAVISSITKSKQIDENYLNIARKESRKMFWNVSFSPIVPLKYKIITTAYLINPSLCLSAIRKLRGLFNKDNSDLI